MELVQRATNLVNEYEKENGQRRVIPEGQDSPVRWTPPVEGTYKLNTDVAVFQEGKVGLGAILRDYMGETVVVTCWMVAGDNKVELGEGLAARHGLKISLEAGFEHIILETDSVKLYTHMKKENEENNIFGRIVQDIKTLACRCLNFEVLHVKR
ncbi:Phosphatidylinositol transfer protein 5 [Bienertia sinuspersici]